jgi:hypothetical protein
MSEISADRYNVVGLGILNFNLKVNIVGLGVSSFNRPMTKLPVKTSLLVMMIFGLDVISRHFPSSRTFWYFLELYRTFWKIVEPSEIFQNFLKLPNNFWSFSELS